MEQGFHMMKQFREGAMGKSELTTGTQAIDRATALLADVLQSQTPPLLGSLARAHDIPKSTTSRILGALERAGLVHFWVHLHAHMTFLNQQHLAFLEPLNARDLCSAIATVLS